MINWPLATYNGLEVDMLSVGDADSILVTQWTNNIATRVLIDAGDSCDASTVKNFLFGRGIHYLDHIVCTHGHDDHAAGLIDLVSDRRLIFGKFWMHLPWQYLNLQTLNEAISRSSAPRVARILNESLQTQWDLANAVWNREKLIYEPFSGDAIGFLTVCGPSRPFYTNLVSQFTDIDQLNQFERQLAAHESQLLMERLDALSQEAPKDDAALGGEPTEPENEASLILATKFGLQVFMFTSDAGTDALYAAANSWPELRFCHWMQIPHHGSRRNVTEELIEWFRPSVAFVSAAGCKNHPRRKVVNAFNRFGTAVFSTHYPEARNLWYRIGFVPYRFDYGPAVSLYDN